MNTCIIDTYAAKRFPQYVASGEMFLLSLVLDVFGLHLLFSYFYWSSHISVHWCLSHYWCPFGLSICCWPGLGCSLECGSFWFTLSWESHFLGGPTRHKLRESFALPLPADTCVWKFWRSLISMAARHLAFRDGREVSSVNISYLSMNFYLLATLPLQKLNAL